MVESDPPIHLPPQTPTKTRNLHFLHSQEEEEEEEERSDLKQLAEEPYAYQSFQLHTVADYS